MTVLVAVLAGLAALLAVGPSARPRLTRLALRPDVPARDQRDEQADGPPEPDGSRSRLRLVACVAVGGCTAWYLGAAVGPPAGVVAGGAVGVGAWVATGRLEPGSVRRRRLALRAALPLGVDLFAAALAVGRPPADALQVVAASVGGPLGEELGVLAARLLLGGDPPAVWREAARVDGLAPLGRTMARSIVTGAPAAEALERLAEDLRRDLRAEREQAARSVGVRAAGPLGLCFLPAFVLVGIVPAVVSAVDSLRLW